MYYIRSESMIVSLPNLPLKKKGKRKWRKWRKGKKKRKREKKYIGRYCYGYPTIMIVLVSTQYLFYLVSHCRGRKGIFLARPILGGCKAEELRKLVCLCGRLQTRAEFPCSAGAPRTGLVCTLQAQYQRVGIRNKDFCLAALIVDYQF